jgi:hypothetical protein
MLLFYFVDIQISDSNNVDIQIVDIKMKTTLINLSFLNRTYYFLVIT